MSPYRFESLKAYTVPEILRDPTAMSPYRFESLKAYTVPEILRDPTPMCPYRVPEGVYSTRDPENFHTYVSVQV